MNLGNTLAKPEKFAPEKQERAKPKRIPTVCEGGKNQVLEVLVFSSPSSLTKDFLSAFDDEKK